MNESPNTPSLPPLRLKPREERRLRSGHLWVFSNEVDTRATPLGSFTPGELVEVQAADGRGVGTGYVNPHSLICARLIAAAPMQCTVQELLHARIAEALELRERLFEGRCYRLVHGESDRLPGLVVDRYDDVLVAQIGTAGMERLRDDIVRALEALLSPVGVLWQNTSPIRELEGLERYTQAAAGTVPETVPLVEHDTRFNVPLGSGQKTGWFFDQRDNRGRALAWASGARVLDVCAYLGAWGVQMAVHGAARVVCVDSSAPAIAAIEENAKLNEVSVELHRQDMFEALKALRDAGARFDVVILDPPAFIKRRKDLRQGGQAYRRLNELALHLLEDGGMLVSCSCSHHLPEADLTGLVQQAAARSGRFVRVLASGGQAPDHPVHPAIAESRYLKALFCHVTSGRA